jgi:hypothetical protein
MYMPSDLVKVGATRQRLVAFFIFLFVVEWYLYFRSAGHYFQADTVFLIYHRATSLPQFLREFTHLQLSGWYRPLSHQLFESILYPFFGLNPVGYRIPVYAIFIANTAAVYALGVALLRRHLPAALGTFFFTIHTTNAFTTYDLGFMPDLLYTFLYLCAVLAYIRFVERGNAVPYVFSIVCFVGSLLSKEAAVTLPAVLCLTHLFLTPAVAPLRVRLQAAVRSTCIHTLITAAYLTFVFGYLHVQAVDLMKLFQKPDVVAEGSYQLVLDKTIAQNADLAASWAFNMPRGWQGGFRQLPETLVTFLSLFRTIAVILGGLLLFTSQRRIVLFGQAWFILTVLPGLPLVNHFLPYYLFLPIVGVSLFIGSEFTWAAEKLRDLHWMAAASVIGILFGGLLVACSASIHADIENHRLLGGSAAIASRSLSDLKRLYPELPPKATIYIDDSEEPLAWDHAWGDLIRMVYERDDITALYASAGDALGLSDSRILSEAIVLKHRGGLTDQTDAFRKRPLPYIPLTTSTAHTLSLSADKIRPRNSFFIVITGARDVSAKIAYIVDRGPTQVFEVALDDQGQSKLEVSESTRKGFYRFVGFAIAGEYSWIRSDATITVE